MMRGCNHSSGSPQRSGFSSNIAGAVISPLMFCLVDKKREHDNVMTMKKQSICSLEAGGGEGCRLA